jgi:trehalose 6-phosphate phosphatase
MKTLKYAANCLQEIKQKAHCAKKAFFFLDYDGTLTEIVSNPDAAFAPNKLINLLNSFQPGHNIISIVSGRKLDDLQNLLKNPGAEKINLIGSHGVEILLAGKSKPENILPDFNDNNTAGFKKIENYIKKICSQTEGIVIEKKPFSFAVHYRNVTHDGSHVIKTVLNYLDKQKKIQDFKYLEMKKVIEIMPLNMSKGGIIPLITRYHTRNRTFAKTPGEYFVLCIGDDITDEDLFEKNSRGINIKVTDSACNLKTAAEYYLKNPQDVLSFLENILIK